MLVCLCAFFQESGAQAKSGLENYSFLGAGRAYSWMPVMHYESARGEYAEVRYNYEEQATVSVFAGKRFSTGQRKVCSFTPMLGFSAGIFSGISPALNAELEWGNLFITAQSQYSFSMGNKDKSFFFNWSEMGYAPVKGFFTGAVVQVTSDREKVLIETGFMAGIEIGKFSIPVYLFNPFGRHRYLMFGINLEYSLR